MLFREEIKESLTLKFAQAAAERRKRGLPIIPLGLGEPDFEVPTPIIESAVEVLRNKRTGYSDSMGIYPLRQKLSYKLKKENSINCSPDNLLVTAGAKQAFQLVCMAILEPGDEAVVINPSFVSFIPQIYIAEPLCKVVTVNINKTDFSVDLQHVRDSITSRTKILIINSPNNPAGYVLNESFLTGVYNLAEKSGFYIISDEIYEKLIFSHKRHFSIGSLEPEPARVITINGFSKSHAMTGWRLGYACFPIRLSPKLLKLQQHINTNTCTFIQQAVEQAFDIDQNYLIEYNRVLLRRAERIVELISKIDNVSLVSPDAGFFAFLNISGLGLDSNTFCSKLIEETGVATTPGIAFGSSWDDHVRLSFATTEENLEMGLDLIRNYIQGIN